MLGEVLRQRRAELGLSQIDLAAATGVDVRQIRRYEGGKHQPTFGVAVRLADALGLTLDQLAGRDPTGEGGEEAELIQLHAVVTGLQAQVNEAAGLLTRLRKSRGRQP